MPANSLLEIATVIRTREVAERTYITDFRSPGIASLVAAGQFVMASFPETSDPLLPRAFSVCDASGETVSLLYVAVGRATGKLSKLLPGEPLMFNGPLGIGFPGMHKGGKIWVVVGGSGAALIPILSRTAEEAGCHVRFFYGARTGSQLVNFDNVEAIGHSTDDGSKGFHGNAVQMVKKELAGSKPPDLLFGCGPTPMLVNMQKELGGNIPTYLSVETPMACGMGFCQGCPVKKSAGGDYYLACKDGPVFKSTEIEFEARP